MKINVLRHLMIPWILLFCGIVAAIVGAGISFHVPAIEHPILRAAILISLIICVYSNLMTLTKSGIWIAHSLPSHLARNPWGWFLRAAVSIGIAWGIFELGEVSWVPLAWQAFVIPSTFAVVLFVAIASVMGPILVWSSKLAFCRSTAWILSLPVFATVPITAVFVGQTTINAYVASRPEPIVMEFKKAPQVLVDETKKNSLKNHASKKVQTAATNPVSVADARIETLKKAVDSGQACPEESKVIQQGLDPKSSEELALWAAKAIKCSDLKAVVALPKLIKLAHDHSSPLVKATAIKAMPKYGSEEMKKLSYLLYKRISENESPEVIEAISQLLIHLGEDPTKIVTKKLTLLLDSTTRHEVAAQLLIHDLKRDDIIVDFVNHNLKLAPVARDRAVGLICYLPDTQKKLIQDHLEPIIAALKTGDSEDPAKKALDCLGAVGLQAVQQEVIKPQLLERSLAARTMAEMDLKNDPEALKTAETCARDSNIQVRKWCSQSLGRLGVSALPQILDLLMSSDDHLKESGQVALGYFDDLAAQPELEKIRAENSGWMANHKKLQVARAIDQALIKMKKVEAPSAKAVEVVVPQGQVQAMPNQRPSSQTTQVH